MATEAAGETASGWRGALPEGVRPYAEPAPLTSLFLGISSGFPFFPIYKFILAANFMTRTKAEVAP